MIKNTKRLKSHENVLTVLTFSTDDTDFSKDIGNAVNCAEVNPISNLKEHSQETRM